MARLPYLTARSMGQIPAWMSRERYLNQPDWATIPYATAVRMGQIPSSVTQDEYEQFVSGLSEKDGFKGDEIKAGDGETPNDNIDTGVVTVDDPITSPVNTPTDIPPDMPAPSNRTAMGNQVAGQSEIDQMMAERNARLAEYYAENPELQDMAPTRGEPEGVQRYSGQTLGSLGNQAMQDMAWRKAKALAARSTRFGGPSADDLQWLYDNSDKFYQAMRNMEQATGRPTHVGQIFDRMSQGYYNDIWQSPNAQPNVQRHTIGNTPPAQTGGVNNHTAPPDAQQDGNPWLREMMQRYPMPEGYYGDNFGYDPSKDHMTPEQRYAMEQAGLNWAGGNPWFDESNPYGGRTEMLQKPPYGNGTIDPHPNPTHPSIRDRNYDPNNVQTVNPSYNPDDPTTWNGNQQGYNPNNPTIPTTSPVPNPDPTSRQRPVTQPSQKYPSQVPYQQAPDPGVPTNPVSLENQYGFGTAGGGPTDNPAFNNPGAPTPVTQLTNPMPGPPQLDQTHSAAQKVMPTSGGIGVPGSGVVKVQVDQGNGQNQQQNLPQPAPPMPAPPGMQQQQLQGVPAWLGGAPSTKPAY